MKFTDTAGERSCWIATTKMTAFFLSFKEGLEYLIVLQCQASKLRKHFKAHSGEKPNKCNQRDLCIFLGNQFEDTFENAQWRKVRQEI